MQTRTILCGLTAGALCAFGYHMFFIQTWPAQYVDGWSSMPGWLSWLGVVFNALVILLAAWTAAAWEWKTTKKEAARVGAATGFIAALICYLFAGSLMAGLLGLEPMLKHGLFPISEMAITSLLLDVIDKTSGYTFLGLIALIALGLVCGIGGGLLAPLSELQLGSAPRQLPGRLVSLPSLFILFFTPLAMMVTQSMMPVWVKVLIDSMIETKHLSINLSLFSNILLSAPQTGFVAFGLGSAWPWLVRWWKLGSHSCFMVYLSLIALASTGYALYILAPEIARITSIIIMLFDGQPFLLFVAYFLLYLVLPLVGFFLLGLWLVEKPPALQDIAPTRAGLFHVLMASIWTGLVALAPAWLVVSFILNIIMGSISVLPFFAKNPEPHKTIIEILRLMIDTQVKYGLNALAFFVILGILTPSFFAFVSKDEQEVLPPPRPVFDEWDSG